jgi:sn-glycerol 3-phosphate transport system substrate-binding protein
MGIFPEFRNTFEDNIEKMLNGRMTPEQVLENTEETATELLEEYNELY